MTRIKICGITEVEHALAAAEAGADYLGMVFKPHSPRQVTAAKAVEIVQYERLSVAHPDTVGVFVNSSAGEVNNISEECHLDWVQLSGDETWEYCRDIERPIIKVMHVSPENTAYNVLKHIEQGHRSLPDHRLICLLDTHVEGAYGGTGLTFSWLLAKEVSEVYPVLVAGGLTPHNVGRLINEAHPWGVDVSSGVETMCIKDTQKIKEFIHTVKSTDGRI